MCIRDSRYIDQMMVIERSSFSHPWSKDSYLHDLNENQLSCYLGVFASEQLIGYAGVWIVLEEGYISNIAIHPDWRRQGAGETLVTALISQCRALGCSAVTLEVRESNLAAIQLYEKLGFRQEGRRPHYYDDGEAALLYWLYLEEPV